MSHAPCCDRDVWSLPPLDHDALAREAAAWANERVPLMPAQDAASGAAALIAELEAALPAARAERDRAAWTVWTDWHVRHGAKLPEAIGVKRVAWKKIKDRLDAEQPAKMSDALIRLPELAAAWGRAAARIEALLRIRYAAEDELLAAGWTKADIARLIGRDPSRVSRRTTDGSAAA